MTDPTLTSPPEWVYKRDGRLVPFDPDKVVRSLYAAAERIGRADAFTARELTDGVLHFLADDVAGAVPTTAQVAEMVVKVVRELGHPTLAQSFAAGEREKDKATPAGVSGAALPSFAGGQGHETAQLRDPRPDVALMREYALREVFSRDLVAAHKEGLLTLTGLEMPLDLAGGVLRPPGREKVFEALEETRRVAGAYVAVDGPEYGLVHSAQEPDDFARELASGLRAAGLFAVVNLNGGVPPSWADDLADGPLFAGQRPERPGARLATLSDHLLNDLLAADAARIDWHVGERDFLATGVDGRLAPVIRRALEGAPIAFAFDRPRRPVALAEGIDRQHPAVLMTVGLHLGCLAERFRRASGATSCDPALFLDKLGPLARMALSAATQKRNFLRRINHSWPTFLLDRARLIVAPVGLEAVVRRLTGLRPCADGAALELARRIVGRLQEVLDRDGRFAHLDVCLDAPAGDRQPVFDVRSDEPAPARDDEGVAGVTLWDAESPLKVQLKAGGPLHAAGVAGTLALRVPEGAAPSVEETASLLRWAWRQTGVARLRFVSPVADSPIADCGLRIAD